MKLQIFLNDNILNKQLNVSYLPFLYIEKIYGFFL